MQLGNALVSVLAVISVVYACGGDGHNHAPQKRASVPLTPPNRALEWGDLNIIHTTDSHGWLLGHQKTSPPEPNYSATLGEFASFVTHMKALAKEKDVDLLLVDSGDLHDGTGLSDGFPPGGIDAHDSNKFMLELPYDIMAIGNHELYIYNNTFDMYKNFAPKLGDRYLSSNVNITVPGRDGRAMNVPVGHRFRKFKTTKGRRVTALGVLYDFTGNDKNTTVQSPTDMVKEAWFAEAIKEEPDVFLLTGHMPVSNDDWPVVHSAVRAVHPHTPILILGGHTHIRDCNQPDGRSIALESGRYMETVGWLSAKLDKKGSTGNITFSRRYLDTNTVTYEYHTGTRSKTFDTSSGKSITQGLNKLAQTFSLGSFFGTAPQDYFLSRSPYPSNDSVLTLLAQNVLPIALAINNSRASVPNVIITNSGSLRFDLYSGNFTKNDQLTVSPFTDAFLYIANITAGVANMVLPALNNAGANQRREYTERQTEMYRRGYVDMRYREWLGDMAARTSEVEKRAAANLTLGYVTKDSCPGVGDDTIHAPLPFFSTPDFIGSTPPSVSDDTPMDLVFVDFIEAQLLGILNSVQTSKNYTSSDVASYSPFLADEVLGLYAEAKWN